MALQPLSGLDARLDPGGKRGRFLRYALELFATDKGLPRALRFLARGVLSREATDRWLAFLDAPALMRAGSGVRPELIMKIHRPFSRRALPTSARVALLIEHYRLLIGVLDTDALASLLRAEPVNLGCIEGRNADRYDLLLRRDRRYSKEGELSISLTGAAHGEALATLSMTIGADEAGRRCLHVGGLQGPRLPLGKPDIVRATRSLDGLRPKRAVFEAACAFAAWFGAEAMLLTSQAGHVAQGSGFRRRTIHAEYDQFWEEFGARPMPDGHYVLPLPPPRRSIDDVAAKKRKEWLKRQDRLAAIADGVALSLDRWTRARPDAAHPEWPSRAPVRERTTGRNAEPRLAMAGRWLRDAARGLALPVPALAMTCIMLLGLAIGWQAHAVVSAHARASYTDEDGVV